MTEHPAHTTKQLRRISRYMLILMLGWTLAVGGSLMFSFSQHRKAFYADVYAQAKSVHAMDLQFRNWIIHHGGVYVEVDEHTQPSPFLKHVPERDITTPSGRRLTLLNSSYAMRQVHERMEQSGDGEVLGHITSLKPLNPANKPDGWEVKALKAFAKGKKEVSGAVVMADGKSYFRYMQPMFTEKSCLKCHQGYKVGGVRGGISVSVPVDVPLSIENEESRALLMGHGAIWLLGLTGLFVGGMWQRKAQLSVEKSSEELRLMTNSIAHAIYGQDMEGRCTFANAACLRMLGYADESELLGQDMHALIHHSRADGTPLPVGECAIHRSIEEGHPLHVDEEFFWCRDGSSFPAEYWAYPIVAAGARYGTVVTFIDISEQKRIHNELKHSQQLLDSIVENVPAMVFLKTADELRFELFNRAGEELLGFSRRDLLGRNDFDLFPEEQASFFTDKDRAVLENHEVMEIPEEPIKTASGEERWLRTHKVGLYDERGRPTHLLGISVDISDQVQARHDLRDSNEHYDDLVRRIPVGIYSYHFQPDGNGRFEYVSPRFCEILGVDGEAVLEDPARGFNAAHPDDLPGLIEANQRAFETGEPFRWEGRFVVHDENRWIKIESDPVLMPSGESIWNGVVIDITARKQAEQELVESQQALAEAQRIAHLGSWHMDLVTNEVYWSKELYELYGYDPAKPPPLYDDSMRLFTPESWKQLNDAIARAVETGNPYELELEAVSEAGETRWMLARGELQRDAQGHASGLRGIVMDITERKLAEIELTKSQQALAEAQRVAQLGNWELDLVNDHLHWSDEIFDIFEIEKTRFGASYEAFLDAIHPDDRQRVNDAYTRSVQEHGYYEITHRLLMPDGRIKQVQERGRSYYDEHGKPVRSVGTVQDITRLHEVEEQLRQAQKMEAVGTLVGGIAHDFNNKLAAITGNLYLAQQSIEGNPDALDRLKSVEKLSFEAASMVQQLLTFARKGKVEQAPLTLVTFIKEAAKLYRVAVPESIHLSVDYGKDPLPVMGDITQLQQVFLNLLTNARDALEGVAEARIDVALIHYEPDATFLADHPEAKGVAAYACLRVSDNGCGIRPEDIGQVFDPFFTTKEQGKGTGLGLAMVYGVVKAHQGIVEVESRKGLGTTFSIYLPLHPEALDMDMEMEEQEVPYGHGELILIADDDVHVMAVFQEVLESFGYKIMVAHDGKEAVELYRQHADEIALVVLDIVMPHMKGPDAAKLIREIRPDAKILYATGYDSQASLKGTTRDAPVLEKPYRMRDVGHIIHATLQGNVSGG